MYKFSLLYSFLFMLNKNVAIMLVIINLGHFNIFCTRVQSLKLAQYFSFDILVQKKILQVGLLSGKRACSGFSVGVNELTSRPLKLTSHSIGT